MMMGSAETLFCCALSCWSQLFQSQLFLAFSWAALAAAGGTNKARGDPACALCYAALCSNCI